MKKFDSGTREGRPRSAIEDKISSHYMRIKKQTQKEQIKMYMKVSKKKLVKMLINCNHIIDILNKK